MSIHIQFSDFVPLSRSLPACGACAGAAEAFKFSYAYQPIVDVVQRTVWGHEALVRGPAGESAHSVLSQINDENRYRFDRFHHRDRRLRRGLRGAQSAG